MARAFEIAVTPVLFGLGGWLLDGWWGTSPIFAIVLAAWGVVGVFVKLWFSYDHEMRQHEDKLATNRRLPRTGVRVGSGGSS